MGPEDFVEVSGAGVGIGDARGEVFTDSDSDVTGTREDIQRDSLSGAE